MTSSEFLSIAIDVSFVMVMCSFDLGARAAELVLSVLDVRIDGDLPHRRQVDFGRLIGRVVSLDMLTISIMGFCGLFAVLVEDTAFIDVAVVLALIGFLTTLALARFAERRRRDPEDDT